jgi:hypothetical protein
MVFDFQYPYACFQFHIVIAQHSFCHLFFHRGNRGSECLNLDHFRRNQIQKFS